MIGVPETAARPAPVDPVPPRRAWQGFDRSKLATTVPIYLAIVLGVAVLRIANEWTVHRRAQPVRISARVFI